MIIYLPLGTNRGSHKGTSILEEFLDSILISRGIAVVTGAGNEGTALLHGSGTIKPDGQVTTHEFNIDENQKIIIEIWIQIPSIASIEIVSPTGELQEQFNLSLEKEIDMILQLSVLRC